MPYTINKLARLSGVSARTLRFYDEINLLKPAFYGENHYRYYREEELLILQQILFFRELGFPLNDIQAILSSNDFDKINALQSHKSQLSAKLARTETLIKTIDRTISHLRGKLMMRDSDLFDGFNPKKQQEHEQYLVDTGVVTQQQINDSWKRVSHWKKADWEAFKQTGEQLYQDFVQAIKAQAKPDSASTQALVRKHFELISLFWTPTKESYQGLGEMYLDHPDFQAFYNRFHPDLARYLVEAMRVFSKQELS